MNKEENLKESLKIIEPKTSLFVIQARNASIAVIFRRGPSKQVQLIKWDKTKETFEEGQWLKGRIYERRCDLSPNGNKLIYLAAKWKEPVYSWTAISKPPYLSALALWPNLGAWGGGGLFEKDNIIGLNHRFDMGYDKLAEGFSIPKKITIKPLGEFSGHGEDTPIYDQHLTRDGWELIEEGKAIEHLYDPSSKIWITYDPPRTYQKATKAFILSMQEKGYHEWNGPSHIIEYSIKARDGRNTFDFGRLDWADWDNNGDLLFAKEGRLFRLKLHSQSVISNVLLESKLLADFSKNRFKEKTAPREYIQW